MSEGLVSQSGSWGNGFKKTGSKSRSLGQSFLLLQIQVGSGPLQARLPSRAPYARPMPKLSRKVLAEFQSRLFEVTIINDVLAIEHDRGFVAGDIHGDAFGNASAD